MTDSIVTNKYVYPNLTKTPTKNSQASKVFNRPWSGNYPSNYNGYYGGHPYGYGGHPYGYGNQYGYPYGGYG